MLNCGPLHTYVRKVVLHYRLERREAMHVGFAPVFMNTSGAMSDLECFKHELALADLAEPLGFDSIWQPEHHFSGYEMTPNVLQFLTYMAGRTKTVRLGSMLVVLPWHNPLRVVEDVTQLDYYSGGRAILGIGRGLGAMEFGGFGIEMSDTRDLFVEKAETVVNALRTGFIEYNGKHVKQPRRNIRPAPFKTFEGRTYGAGLSPETMPILARLGAGPMIFPYKSWQDTSDTLNTFKKSWRELRPGTTPPKRAVLPELKKMDKGPVAEPQEYSKAAEQRVPCRDGTKNPD